MLGIDDIEKLFINTILLLTKYYIFSCKYKKVYPSFSEVISILKINLRVELYCSTMLSPAKRQKIQSIWDQISNFIGD